MKRVLFLSILIFTVVSASAKERAGVFQGCDGGMMIHSGYLWGLNLPGHSGAPVGIGGVARAHLSKHWRVGVEGYTSHLPQLGNGSYAKFGWGGVLADFYWRFGRLMPYVGLTVGGGARRDLLMLSATEYYYNRTGFMALDPFVGCEFILSESFHLTLKLDWLNTFARNAAMPTGPRLYFGFIFSH